MRWHLEILPREQRALWDERVAKGFPDFVLYGGTALALRLGHRQSNDFDFFSSRPFAPMKLRDALELEGEILQAEPNTLTLLCRSVKLSFFGKLSLGVVAAPEPLGACRIASLPDVSGCKMAALVNRVELKDYLDVAAILRAGLSLGEVLGFADAIYHGEFPVASCVKALTYFDPPELACLGDAERRLIERAIVDLQAIEKPPLFAPRISGDAIGNQS